MTELAFVVTFGRSDGSAIKHLFGTRKQALDTANALAFVFFYEHPFKYSKCHDTPVRVEKDGFFVQFDRTHAAKQFH